MTAMSALPRLRSIVTALAVVSISLLTACAMESEDLVDDEAVDASQPG